MDFLAQLLRLPTDKFELPPSGPGAAAGVGAGVLPSPPSSPPPLVVVPHTLLLVTRENGEHCNFFHALTDFFNAFLMVKAFRLERPHLQLLMMDNHGPSPFDEAWGRVFSGPPLKPKRRGAFAPSSDKAQPPPPPHPVLKLHQLLGVGFGNKARVAGGGEGMVLASSVVVSPPGYSSPFYRHLFEDDPSCGGGGGGAGAGGEAGADLVKEFAAHFLSGYADNPLVAHRRWPDLGATLEDLAGITPQQQAAGAVRRTIIPALARQPPAASGAGSAGSGDTVSLPLQASEGVLHLVLVSRRPYDRFVEHKKIARQILNEEEGLLDFLTSGSPADAARYSDVRLDVVDLARLDLQQQLALITSTDILIGMHGAVRTYHTHTHAHSQAEQNPDIAVGTWRAISCFVLHLLVCVVCLFCLTVVSLLQALSHTLFLPPWSALVELHPLMNRWMCFKHQTEVSQRASERQSSLTDQHAPHSPLIARDRSRPNHASTRPLMCACVCVCCVIVACVCVCVCPFSGWATCISPGATLMCAMSRRWRRARAWWSTRAPSRPSSTKRSRRSGTTGGTYN